MIPLLRLLFSISFFCLTLFAFTGCQTDGGEGSWFNSELLYMVIEFLAAPLLAAATWGVSKLSQLISTKVKNEYAAGVLSRLSYAALQAVKGVQQAFVDAIKKGREDGVLTDEEKAYAAEQALAALKSYLGPKGLKEIGNILGLNGLELDKALSHEVEAAVHDLRTNAGPRVPLA